MDTNTSKTPNTSREEAIQECLRLADGYATTAADYERQPSAHAKPYRLRMEEARAALESAVRALHDENAKLKTVMIAAAEEIHKHWSAHCDADGYGPANLMRRLEEGIPSEYGYTAGRFAELQAEVAALRATHPSAPPAGYVLTEPTAAARDVLAERRRQAEAEGWTPAHDDEHDNQELTLAAVCYAFCSARPQPEWMPYGGQKKPPPWWPWGAGWWRPKSPRRDLIKACALILAEIERLDRAALAATPAPTKEAP